MASQNDIIISDMNVTKGPSGELFKTLEQFCDEYITAAGGESM